MSHAKSPEKVVQEIRRKTRRQFSTEEKIRIVLDGLRGEESIAALCRREGLNPQTERPPNPHLKPGIPVRRWRLMPGGRAARDEDGAHETGVRRGTA